jgi:glycogen debranching enzyme
MAGHLGQNTADVLGLGRQGIGAAARIGQGCLGQLPEIYDGDQPYEGKGCFAQAWSVGEMLRVYEDIYRIEQEA